MKKIIVLGITGNLGKKFVELIDKFGEYEIIAASYNTNKSTFELIQNKILSIKHYNCHPDYVQDVKNNVKIKYHSTIEGLIKECGEYHALINLMSGIEALPIVETAIRTNHLVYSANKQILLLGGDYLRKTYSNFNKLFISLDSELSALKDLISGRDIQDLKSVTITMSGGLLWKTDPNDYKNISNNNILKTHPIWDMGINNTFDSNTLINKLFEIIEVSHCFNIGLDNINVVLHPESNVHAIVEWKDGSMFYAVSKPSMILAMQKMLYNKILICNDNSSFYKAPPSINFVELNTYQKAIISWKNKFVNNINLGILLFAINEVYFELFHKNKIHLIDIIDFFENNFNKFHHLIKKNYSSTTEIMKSYNLVLSQIKIQYDSYNNIK